MRRKVRKTLKKGAFPSIFPNCPSYLRNATASCQRFSLDDKVGRRIQEAYLKSLAEFKESEAKFTIFTLNCIICIISKLHLVELPVGWVIYRPNYTVILFLKIKYHDEISTIERSIIIDEKLYCKAFYKGTNKIQLSCHLPITDIRSLKISLMKYIII